MSQSQKILVFHHVLFARHAINALYHAESLLVSNNLDIRILLAQQTDTARMIRLRVIHDDILDILDRRNLG